MIFVLSPNTDDPQKDFENAKRLCLACSFADTPVSPVLSFAYDVNENDWRRKYSYQELMVKCESVRVFCDEVTELMIKLIKVAIEKEIPIEFYEANGNHIEYDALIINKNIGPGLRQMIRLAHGDVQENVFCPHCGKKIAQD